MLNSLDFETIPILHTAKESIDTLIPHSPQKETLCIVQEHVSDVDLIECQEETRTTLSIPSISTKQILLQQKSLPKTIPETRSPTIRSKHFFNPPPIAAQQGPLQQQPSKKPRKPRIPKATDPNAPAKKQRINRKKTRIDSRLLPVKDALHAIHASSTHLFNHPTSQKLPFIHRLDCQIRNFVDSRDAQEFEFCPRMRISLWERAAREHSQEVSDLEYSSSSKPTEQGPSTPALEASISKLKSTYQSRIAEASKRLERKITELQQSHQNWVTKEEEECQEIIENMIKEHAFHKERNSFNETMAPVLLLDTVDSNTDRIARELEKEFETGYISQDLISPVRTREQSIPTACVFNLSSPGSSLDDDCLLDLV